MRHIIALAALAWSSVWLCPAAPAQGNAGTTYYGWNGPASGSETGETFSANIYGDAIEVVPAGDECSRPFYIQGVMTMKPDGTGTIDGTMTRCTNPELFDCGHLINYEVSFHGNVTRSGNRYFLELNYTMEIWNKDTCKKEKEERQTESLQLLYMPPTPPEPTTAEVVRETYDLARQWAYDQFWTIGGLFPH